MTTQIVANASREILVSMNYDPTGKAWVELFDNQPIGWAVDDTDLSHPLPVIIGSLPPAAPDTAPIASPQWAVYGGGVVAVADVVRLPPREFFTWLATNGGATRLVRSSMVSADLNQAFHQWNGGAP